MPVSDGQLSGTTQLEGEEERLTVQAMLLNQDGCRNPHWIGEVFEDSPGEPSARAGCVEETESALLTYLQLQLLLLLL